jgi:hypothetical protein
MYRVANAELMELLHAYGGLVQVNARCLTTTRVSIVVLFAPCYHLRVSRNHPRWVNPAPSLTFVVLINSTDY